MKIVLYNTASSKFDGRYSSTTVFPKKTDEWDKLASSYPEHEFILVTKIPGMFTLDMKVNEIAKRSDKIKYVIVPENSTVDEIAQLILEQTPSIAIAVSLPGIPLDWNTIKDGLVAEQLQKRGIKTVSHSVYTAVAFFDKWRSHLVLCGHGFGVAKAMYVHNDLFWAEKTNLSVSTNVYKEYVLYRIKDMSFPVIIKDVVGAGSIGIKTADTYEETISILNSDQNTTDLMVEELILGEQFGAEIHGVKGNYHVLPPFSFSINDKGIVDPFQSVKFGPVTNKKYNIPLLQESLRRLAETLEFAGCTQIDLVFKDDKWYIIEVNPRWSGMTTTTAAMQGRQPLAVFVESALGSKKDYNKIENLKYVVSFKIPALEDEELAELYEHPYVHYVVKDIIAPPGGGVLKYCELVFGGYDTKEELIAELKAFRDKYPDVISKMVVENAEKLAGEGV
jgi:biotin carboxylase